MANVSDFRFRVRRDTKLTPEEIERIINGVTEENMESRILLRREIVRSKMTFVCLHCKKSFIPKLTKKFISKALCSDECSTKYYNSLRSPKPQEKTCPICGEKHTPIRGEKCSNCADKFIKTCYCGKTFIGSKNKKLCDDCVASKKFKVNVVVEKPKREAKPKVVKPKKIKVPKVSKDTEIYLQYRKLKSDLTLTEDMSDIIRISKEIITMEQEHHKIINKIEKEYGVK